MTIKTRLIITAIITLVLAFLVSYTLFFTTAELKEEIEELKMADEILKGIFELNVISSNFLLYHEQRAKEQWRSRYDSISEFIQPEKYGTSKESLILAELDKNYQKMKQVFDDLGRLYDRESIYSLELENRLTSQLLLLSQEVFIRASSLNKEVRSEVTVQVEKLLLIVTRTIIVFVLIITFGIWLIIKMIVRPIAKLQKGIEIVGQGKLDYKIDIKSKDEIGQLATAFNIMAEEISASQSNLEDKVEARTEELEEKKQSLEKQQQAILNILEDIEEEKSNVNSEKDKIDAILNSIGDGVFVVDSLFRIFVFNKHAVSISGFSEDEIVGKVYNKVLNFVNERDGESRNEFVIRAMEGNKVLELPMYCGLKHKDGKTITAVAATASPLNDKNGNIIGCVVVFRDTTKERQIDKTKTEFVSLASHQLRTPLSTINWYAEMLLAGDAGKLTKNQKTYLNEIYTGNQRMVSLVNALLNTSRIELGTFAVNPKSMDFVAEAQSVLKELEPEIQAKKLVVNTEFAKLPKITADPDLIRIIFHNLFTNAVKYTPEGGKVDLSISMNNGSIEVQVSDSGYGIPKKQQDEIFTKLFRADNVKEKDTTGTGLGLYIVKSILDHSGGKIWFESPTIVEKTSAGKEEGKGTTFYVTLPKTGMVKKKGPKKLDI